MTVCSYIELWLYKGNIFMLCCTREKGNILCLRFIRVYNHLLCKFNIRASTDLCINIFTAKMILIFANWYDTLEKKIGSICVKLHNWNIFLIVRRIFALKFFFYQCQAVSLNHFLLSYKVFSDECSDVFHIGRQNGSVKWMNGGEWMNVKKCGGKR